ncbi:hypothetical protein FHX48_002340 [Microbacterium halimionae]|uniref:Glycosyl hydrolases family 43 n=1 Tax=Microbacterium halimionae TaxID=1526413 RepID=A0A7W3PMS0_9MICO|nr:family 43 glycosylhydrolase [Microbacterium halimionae]MBA8817242.1 hypothetical protein [Microbacterium halimionae]NII94692.1 hypothetical protein [Microbacterium halimionae]
MGDRPLTPREVYRDPVYDGATDPNVVHDGESWCMLYTQRRATHPDPGDGVAWVHGSRIGVARSADGVAWEYAGTLEPASGGLVLHTGPPPEAVDSTFWAPEVIHDGERWHMYATEIDGVPTQWAGHDRRIVEYVSDDLARWTRRGALKLASTAVIDAAVARCPDGLWRLWYKDEAADSVTKVAASADLDAWREEGVAIGGRAHEGPFVFHLGGWWWMLTDEWRGMAVYRSVNALTWTRQGGVDDVILGEADARRLLQVGRHGAVAVVDGNAWLYYFTHPWWDAAELADGAESVDARFSTIHRVQLVVTGDVLTETKSFPTGQE